MIKIICVDNKFYPISLEINKEYQAKETECFYIILDENFEEHHYPKEIFTKIKKDI